MLASVSHWFLRGGAAASVSLASGSHQALMEFKDFKKLTKFKSGLMWFRVKGAFKKSEVIRLRRVVEVLE